MRLRGPCCGTERRSAAPGLVSREFIGVGLQAFANLNPKASYGGLALFVQFGRL
jgi:hypothetical protein